jgi:hypothetical protein
MAKKVKAKTTAKKVAVKRTLPTTRRTLPKGYVAVTDIGRSVGLDGKTTRRKIRASGEFKKSKEYGWAVPTTKRQAVVSILKS